MFRGSNLAASRRSLNSSAFLLRIFEIDSTSDSPYAGETSCWHIGQMRSATFGEDLESELDQTLLAIARKLEKSLLAIREFRLIEDLGQ